MDIPRHLVMLVGEAKSAAGLKWTEIRIANFLEISIGYFIYLEARGLRFIRKTMNGKVVSDSSTGGYKMEGPSALFEG